MSLLFKPMGILAGLIAGTLAKRIFEKSWSAVTDEELPEAEHREVEIPRLIVALALEGAIFALVRGLVDHGARLGFAKYTGAWPGEEYPKRK